MDGPRRLIRLIRETYRRSLRPVPGTRLAVSRIVTPAP